MYYSLSYIEEEKKAFEAIGKSELYSRKSIRELLKIEGNFTIDISNKFFQKQSNKFPYGVIRDFLSVYPKLDTTLKTRYKIEKEFLLRSLDNEGYLVGAQSADIELFNEYYLDGYEIGGTTALSDVKSSLISGGGSNMQKVGKNMGISFNLTDPVVREKLKWEAGRRITRINETTRRLVVNTLIGAYDKGAGYDGMKKDLKNLFEGWKVPKSGQWFTNKRAEIIARTELGQAVSWAREESYARRDVKRKSWLAGPKSCDVCILAVGDGVITFSQAFSNGFLGPLAHPSCICCLLPEVEIQDYLQGYTWHGEAQDQVHTQS